MIPMYVCSKEYLTLERVTWRSRIFLVWQNKVMVTSALYASMNEINRYKEWWLALICYLILHDLVNGHMKVKVTNCEAQQTYGHIWTANVNDINCQIKSDGQYSAICLIIWPWKGSHERLGHLLFITKRQWQEAYNNSSTFCKRTEQLNP